ncbi:glycoside hydrolase superfamily [Gongronella butleri]|nr:glycoside hydrolase superfamily [Gongronella butleri]
MNKVSTVVACLLGPLILVLLYFHAFRDDLPNRAPMDRPDVPAPSSPASSSVLGGYFVNWAIYDRGYQVADVPADKLTHILYAFASLGSDGTVALSDPWADTDKPFAKGVHGNLGEFHRVKQAHPHLKISLSVGGWGLGANFSAVASDEKKRRHFASTAADLVQKHSLDGLDIDWEFPATESDAQAMVALLRDVRAQLGDQALISVAVGCGQESYAHLDLHGMSDVVNFFFLMAYDFSGPWEDTVGHQAPLYPAIDAAVQHYASVVPRNKLILGLPAYGRAFHNTLGLGASFQGDATHDTRTLPRAGAEEYVDQAIGASWSYDASTREFISYDNEAVIEQKARYALAQGLAGCFFWEIAGDAMANGEHRLINAAHRVLAA